MLKLLEKLTQTTAPSGSEAELHDLIREEIKDFVDEISVDALGNLIAHKKGQGARVMFAAHTDEIGLIVTFITDEGYLKFSNLGGVLPMNALYQRVRFINGTEGVVALDNTNVADKKEPFLSDLYVDIGAKNKEEAETMVKIGDTAVFCGHFATRGNRIVSKALDDRCGC